MYHARRVAAMIPPRDTQSSTDWQVYEDHAALIVRAVNAHDALVAALEAIRARISGEWDHPALVAIGALETDQGTDVMRIVRAALEIARNGG